MPDAKTDVYVADTIGELGTLYSLSPVALIGGSLVDKGGQNPVEAIRHGAAVLTGPYRQNFGDIFEALLAKGGAREVSSAEDLAQAVIALIGDAAALEEQRTKAEDALDEMTGALEKTVEALIAPLPEPEVDQKELDCAS